MNTKLYLNILYSVLLVLSTIPFHLNAQTLTVGQVHSYQTGDVICTRIDYGDQLPYYSVDTIVSRVNGSDQITFIKNRTEFTYQAQSGLWKGQHFRDTLVISGLNTPYFSRFLSKDSLSIEKDSNNNITSVFKVKDSVFKDACQTQANYNRQYSRKSSTGQILQTVTVYEGVGIFIHYEQTKNLMTLIDETPQFYISNGKYCGDSGVMTSFRKLSVDPISASSIRIWPNPVTELLNINLNEPFEYEIYTNSGQLIRQGQSESDTLNVSLLCSGLYHLKLSYGNQILYFKFHKE